MPSLISQTQLYPVRCTECGETIENKFFSLNNFLKQYAVNGSNSKRVSDLVDFLGIGAMYGETVLPDVPPLYTDGSWFLDKPEIGAGSVLPEFDCADNEIPEDRLVLAQLNIASMVAQFGLATGFWEIYSMLKLRKELDTQAEAYGEASNEQAAQWKTYCDKITQIPGVKVDTLLTQDKRNATIGGYLSSILSFAEEEAKEPEKRNYAAQDLLIGWRYKVENNRKLPYAFVARGALTGSYDTRECCCDKCRRPIPWELGAYRQKIIGILGTQAVGKTTYLVALADVIRELKFKKLTITHDSADPQWKRVEQENGLLWIYQNGFIPPKSPVEEGGAPALSFKIQRTPQSEPVVYTLADIPGEAFYDAANAEYPQAMIDSIKRLLLASDSLILVVNEDQLQKSEVAQEEISENKLVKNSSNILTSFKTYLPGHPISTAVILSAADKIGNLRKQLKIAFDIRNLPPLVYCEKENRYVYNAEMMRTASQAVEQYMDDHFQQFVHNLRNGFVPDGSTVSAFAVSSGTQCAVDFQGTEEKKDSAMRYASVCRERFGVAAPLLWLLACDGMLDAKTMRSMITF